MVSEKGSLASGLWVFLLDRLVGEEDGADKVWPRGMSPSPQTAHRNLHTTEGTFLACTALHRTATLILID